MMLVFHSYRAYVTHLLAGLASVLLLIEAKRGGAMMAISFVFMFIIFFMTRPQRRD